MATAEMYVEYKLFRMPKKKPQGRRQYEHCSIMQTIIVKHVSRLPWILIILIKD